MPETLPMSERKSLAVRDVLGAFRQTVTNRQTLGYALAAGGVQGSLFAFVFSSQQVFTGIYKLGHYFPLAFAAIAIGVAVAGFLNARFVGRIGMRVISHGALVGFVAVAGIMLAATKADMLPLPLFMALAALMMFAFGLMFANFTALAMEPQGHIAGTASSLYGSITTLLGWQPSPSFWWWKRAGCSSPITTPPTLEHPFLSPGEYRSTLFLERLDSFLGIRRSGNGGQGLRLLLQLAFQRTVRGLQEQPLDAAIGPEASSRAIRIASAPTASSSTTKSARPADSAASASSVSANRKNRLARAGPMRAVSVVVDPLSGLKPIFANADVTRTDFPITTRSAAAISDTLPPATLPWTAATTGARIRTIRTMAA